jgi:hypothetical protein
LLWWIIAIIIVFQDGPGAALAWMFVPYIVIAAHEFGHWIAAWLARVPTMGTVVHIGVGPHIGVDGGRVRLGLLPGGGRVALAVVPGRWPRIVIALGGSAGNAVLGIVLAIIGTQMQNTPVWIGLPALASLAVAVASLIPLGSKQLGRTDGYEVVSALFNR